MVVHAVTPSAPATSYVSDGTVVHRTTDGGCTWREVWRVPATPSAEFPYSSAFAQVVQLAVATTSTRVIALVQDGIDGDEKPVGGTYPGQLHVVRSDDGGKSWEAGDDGLLAAGVTNVQRQSNDISGQGRCGDSRGCALRFAPSNPDIVYLIGETTGLTPGHLFRSTDGGRSWETRSTLGDPAGGGVVPGGAGLLAVDPGDPDVLWSTMFERLSTSRDGGLTWSAVHPDTVYGELVTLQRSPGRPTRVFHLQHNSLRGSGAFQALRSDDSGKSFRPASLAGISQQLIDSLASGTRPDDLVALSAAGTGSLQAYAPLTSRWRNVDTAGLIPRFGPGSDVQAHRGGFSLLGPKHLLTYRGPVGQDLKAGRTTVVRPR